MNTKLTLRVEAAIVRKAKRHAARRGKSVSQMFSEFVTSLEAAKDKRDLPPLTASLLGVIGDAQVSEEDYKKHLREKYL
jgi:predicted membrane GTPase involved in stress response